MDTQRIQTFIRRARKGVGYLARGDLKSFMSRLRATQIEYAAAKRLEVLPGTLLTWCVMATPHTMFIAHLIAKRLREHGWNVTVTTSVPEQFDAHFYIVVCPQMFGRLPPRERRFVFQMEQSVSSRWFTKNYLRLLARSRSVLDYALVNIDFLDSRSISYPHVYYVPVGSDPSYTDGMQAESKRYDVLFYGDAASSKRRQRMLATLEKHFKVHRCSEVFGAEMAAEIRRAKVVINIHYYENALLEMPRIQECLALGVPVVSEAAQDQGDYPELGRAVRFFEEGNEDAMVEAVRSVLNDPIEASDIRAAASKGWERFCFMFDRFLVGAKMLPYSKVLDDPLPLSGASNCIALSLPETIKRRRNFETTRAVECETFDGMRYTPGWIGCGLSYSAIARHALRHQLPRLTVFEDDALFSEDVTDQMRIIETYLDARSGQWDVFAGVIADLHPDVNVLHVEHFDGMRFVIIDKMTSMVCNIYSRRALELLSDWNPNDPDVETNTIDRYLEKHSNLRVVVALPFIAGLREDLDSTLWGIDNRRYLEMIADAQRRLEAKVAAFINPTV